MLVTQKECRGGGRKLADWGRVLGRVQASPCRGRGTGRRGGDRPERRGRPPFGAALRLGQALPFLQVFEAIHSACLTVKLFATVLLHNVGVLLQSGVHAM